MQAGNVRALTGYFRGAELPGEATPYYGFVVWGKEIVSEEDFDAFDKDLEAFWTGYFTREGLDLFVPQSNCTIGWTPRHVRQLTYKMRSTAGRTILYM
jgi:hypothetical protein